jgi:hypothetical protein
MTLTDESGEEGESSDVVELKTHSSEFLRTNLYARVPRDRSFQRERTVDRVCEDRTSLLRKKTSPSELPGNGRPRFELQDAGC